MRNIDPSLARTFLMVVETTKVTTAAQMLHISQAAVSQQIKRLEELIDATLFHRSRKGLAPTPRALELIVPFRNLVSANDHILDLTATAPKTAVVRIACPDDLIGAFLPRILRRLALSRPNLRISLACATTPQLKDGLADGTYDVILTTEEHRTDPSGIALMRDPLVFFGYRGGRARNLRPLPVSIGSGEYGLRAATVAALNQSGIPWRAVSEVDHVDVITALVGADLAIAPLLRSTVPPQFDILGPQDGLPELPEFDVLLYHRGTEQDEIGQVARYIADHAADSPGAG